MSAIPNNKFEAAEQFLLHEGDAFLTGKIESFGELKLPSGSDEARRCANLSGIISDYSMRKSPKRPLSIAMFGPPGSGKSFTVEQLAIHARGNAHAQGKPTKPETINLSQIDDPSQLAESLAYALDPRASDMPLVLFDEFDASLNGEPLGWLKWFLAPMQDAIFFHKGQNRRIQKAVFFFAGGTAERFEDFERRHADYFIERKGPDFVSRLRGVMNIEGVNSFDSDRMLRRALLLQIKLKEAAEHLHKENDPNKGTLKIDQSVLRQLLDGGYYTHGARSIEALLDMCRLADLAGTDGKFTEDRLPDEELRRLHVGRGPLNDWTIGISAGLFESSPGERVAKAAIERGATVAFCGSLGETLNSILDTAQGLTDQLIRPEQDYRVWNPVGYPAFLKPDFAENRTNRSAKAKLHVNFEELQTLSEDEKTNFGLSDDYFDVKWKEGYNPKHHLAWALSLFRMRVRFIQNINALFVVGGKGGRDSKASPDPPWGRFSGLAEEVMLALAFNKPIYVAGMSQGAAEDVGILLGLSNMRLYELGCLPSPANDNYAKLTKEIESFKPDPFQTPQNSALPQNIDSLREFLREHAIESPGWPSNGLTTQENRKLFNASSDDIDDCVKLIMRGITQLNWARQDSAISVKRKCPLQKSAQK